MPTKMMMRQMARPTNEMETIRRTATYSYSNFDKDSITAC